MRKTCVVLHTRSNRMGRRLRYDASTLAKQLEQLGREGQFEGVAELIEQAGHEFVKAKTELEKFRIGNKS